MTAEGPIRHFGPNFFPPEGRESSVEGEQEEGIISSNILLHPHLHPHDTLKSTGKEGEEDGVSDVDPNNPSPSEPEDIYDEILMGIDDDYSSEGKSINPWLANPNQLTCLLMALYDLQQSESQNRQMESEQRIALNLNTYDMGMDEAHLAKVLKDKEAQQRFLEAASSFGQALIGIGQLSSMSAARAKAAQERDSYATPSGQNVQIAQQNYDKMEAKFKSTIAVSDKNDPQAIENAMKNNPQLQKAQMELNQAKTSHQAEYRDKIREANEEIRLKGDVLKSTFDGITSTLKGVISQQQGETEQLKAQLSTLVTFLRQLMDNINTDVSNSRDQVNKLTQLIAQLSSDYRRMHGLSGSM